MKKSIGYIMAIFLAGIMMLSVCVLAETTKPKEVVYEGKVTSWGFAPRGKYFVFFNIKDTFANKRALVDQRLNRGDIITFKLNENGYPYAIKLAEKKVTGKERLEAQRTTEALAGMSRLERKEWRKQMFLTAKPTPAPVTAVKKTAREIGKEKFLEIKEVAKIKPKIKKQTVRHLGKILQKRKLRSGKVFVQVQDLWRSFARYELKTTEEQAKEFNIYEKVLYDLDEYGNLISIEKYTKKQRVSKLISYGEKESDKLLTK